MLVVALLAGATVGCSWLVGVSEDPVVVDLGPDAADGSVGEDPDHQDAHESAAPDLPDAEDAGVADAPDG
jgi:hypothetical protein